MKYSIRQRIIYYIFAGAVTGVCNGLFGGGGGMILVPALAFFLGAETKKAHATAIAVILPVSVVSAAIYYSSGNFPSAEGLPVSFGVAVGGIIGAFALGKIKAKGISLLFSALMLVAGVKMFL